MSRTTTTEEHTPMTTTDLTTAVGGNPLVERLIRQAAAVDTLLHLVAAHNLRSGRVDVSDMSSMVAVDTVAEFLAWATALDFTEFTTWRNTTGQIVLMTDARQIDTTRVLVIAHVDHLPDVSAIHVTKPLTDLTAVVAGAGVG